MRMMKPVWALDETSESRARRQQIVINYADLVEIAVTTKKMWIPRGDGRYSLRLLAISQWRI